MKRLHCFSLFQCLKRRRETMVVGSGEQFEALSILHFGKRWFTFNHKTNKKSKINTLPQVIIQAGDALSAHFFGGAQVEIELVFVAQATMHPGMFHFLRKRRFHLEHTNREIGLLFAVLHIKCQQGCLLNLISEWHITHQLRKDNSFTQATVNIERGPLLPPNRTVFTGYCRGFFPFRNALVWSLCEQRDHRQEHQCEYHNLLKTHQCSWTTTRTSIGRTCHRIQR